MAHQKKCPGCGKEFWGNINKKTCSESCRKYCSRKNIDLNTVVNFPVIKTDNPPLLYRKCHEKAGHLAVIASFLMQENA